MAYCGFHICCGDGWETELRDSDGSALYEIEYGDLLLELIRRNNILNLQKYISVTSKEATVAPGEGYLDPFYVAVSAGSTAALHVLLDIYAAVVAEDTSQTTPLEERSFSLFHVACSFARVKMAPFLMERVLFKLRSAKGSM